ncbi:hypothetical protein GGR52DRAFT_592504 [Hypoxylon sp. FL1284]|nr:hypothetical protein GGR52DRAFT_592504 [Hypoxylon sp. FL1284]
MGICKSFIGKLFLLSLSCSTAIAAPAAELLDETEARENGSSLAVRASGTQRDPIPAHFDITGWENIAEEDCYVMLCLENGNRVYQRVGSANAGTPNRQHAGTTTTPFQLGQLTNRLTSQISHETDSAEEFPWASTQQGGSNAYLLPATRAEQNRQKIMISAGYNRKGGPGYDQWFEINFTGQKLGKFCSALHQDPPDTSVCGNDETTTIFGVAGIILANFVYHIARTQSNKIIFHHAAGSRKGNKRFIDAVGNGDGEVDGDKFHF